MRRTSSHVLGIAALFLALAIPRLAHAEDATCPAATNVPPVRNVDRALTEADAVVNPLDRPRARALYLAVLARDPLDNEAGVGLANLDAKSGCDELAEHGYRLVLVRSPGNVAARAGLADVLIRKGRFRQAEMVLDGGLHEAPLDPELLTRRARAARFRGDPGLARVYLAEAERVSPLSPEIKDERDLVYLGQGRIGHRAQFFPSGFDDIQTTDLSVMQRVRRLRLEGGVTILSRYGATRETRSGPTRTTILDGRPSAGLYYHFDNGAWFGGSAAFATPADALPRYALGLAGSQPIHPRLAFEGNAAFWNYRDDRDVIILSPALRLSVTDQIDLTARYWLTAVFAGEAGKHSVHSAGLRASYRFDTRSTVGLDYTYGIQLERNPSVLDFLTLRSHIVTLLGLHMFTRRFGADLALSFEARTNTANDVTALGPAIEAGVFLRW